MDISTMKSLGQAGGFAAIAFAAIGSSIGAGIAGSSAVGSWKKCYLQNKVAPFQLVIFAGAPLSQSIYGMILMFIINTQIPTHYVSWPLYLGLGVIGGISMGVSSWFQGVAGASACDAFGETGKGFVNYLMILGIVETVSIFILAFGIVLLSTVPAIHG